MNQIIEGARNCANLSFLDTHPREESLRTYVFEGLSRDEKCIASKFLYDKLGSILFDKICDQPEYYQTDAELEILDSYAKDMIAGAGRTLLIELGSGHSRKIRRLLQHLPSGSTYVPIDISRDYLLDHAEKIALDFPHIKVAALCADFLTPLEMPVNALDYDNRIVFFPGSTIGNFERPTQRRIIANAAKVVGSNGAFVIGVDRKNSRDVLEAAYNDAAGMTAAFELNLLRRVNRELGADFNLENFTYSGSYNEQSSRIEMYLVSTKDQIVAIEDHKFRLAAGEKIHLENSYKYEPNEFADLCRVEGLHLDKTWTNKAEQFFVYRFCVK